MKGRWLFAASLLVLGGTASAADLPVYEPVAPPPVFNWSGFYGGLHLGGAFGADDDDLDCGSIAHLVGEDGEEIDDPQCFRATAGSGPHAGKSLQAFELDDDWIGMLPGRGDDNEHVGLLAGAQAGFNWQFGRFLLGIEGDISAVVNDDREGNTLVFDYFHSLGAGTLTNYEGTGFVTGKANFDWLATLRGRLGVVLGPEDRLLIYGTGGVAFADVDSSLSGRFDGSGGVDWCRAGCFFGRDHGNDDIDVGWALGLGAEWAFTDRLSLGIEYLFVGFDHRDHSITFFGDDGRRFDIKESFDFDQHILRGKLNFRFKGPQ